RLQSGHRDYAMRFRGNTFGRVGEEYKTSKPSILYSLSNFSIYSISDPKVPASFLQFSVMFFFTRTRSAETFKVGLSTTGESSCGGRSIKSKTELSFGNNAFFGRICS